MIMSLSIR